MAATLSAMAMAPKMKRLFVVLFVFCLVTDVVILVYLFWPSAPEPQTKAPIAAGASQSQVRNEKPAPSPTEGEAPSSGSKTSELLDDLLGFAPENATQKTILYGGSELLAVEGMSIQEDKATGKVLVRGLRRVEISSGGVVESSADGELTYDPATGMSEITASSISFTSPTEK